VVAPWERGSATSRTFGCSSILLSVASSSKPGETSILIEECLSGLLDLHAGEGLLEADLLLRQLPI
jgi:hypothetical protein